MLLGSSCGEEEERKKGEDEEGGRTVGDVRISMTVTEMF